MQPRLSRMATAIGFSFLSDAALRTVFIIFSAVSSVSMVMTGLFVVWQFVMKSKFRDSVAGYITSTAYSVSRRGCLAVMFVEADLQNTRDMKRFTAGAILDLVPARRAIGDDECIACGLS